MCCSDRDRKSNQESTGTSHDRLQFRSHATVTTPAYHVMLHRRCAVYPDRVQTLPNHLAQMSTKPYRTSID
jgi:hypothetical protein